MLNIPDCLSADTINDSRYILPAHQRWHKSTLTTRFHSTLSFKAIDHNRQEEETQTFAASTCKDTSGGFSIMTSAQTNRWKQRTCYRWWVDSSTTSTTITNMNGINKLRRKDRIKVHLEADNEETTQAGLARGIVAPSQPTPREMQGQNLPRLMMNPCHWNNLLSSSFYCVTTGSVCMVASAQSHKGDLPCWFPSSELWCLTNCMHCAWEARAWWDDGMAHVQHGVILWVGVLS